MKKGEIWLVEILSLGGHEQEGKRPAIVLADTKTPVTIVIPCTSSLQALRFPYTIKIVPSKRNGLRDISMALIFQIRAIDKQRLKQRIGVLESQNLKTIDAMLKKMLVL